jgi:hypothetical protein
MSRAARSPMTSEHSSAASRHACKGSSIWTPSVPAAYHTQDTIDFFLSYDIPPEVWKNEITFQSTWRA